LFHSLTQQYSEINKTSVFQYQLENIITETANVKKNKKDMLYYHNSTLADVRTSVHAPLYMLHYNVIVTVQLPGSYFIQTSTYTPHTDWFQWHSQQRMNSSKQSN